MMTRTRFIGILFAVGTLAALHIVDAVFGSSLAVAVASLAIFATIAALILGA